MKNTVFLNFVAEREAVEKSDKNGGKPSIYAAYQFRCPRRCPLFRLVSRGDIRTLLHGGGIDPIIDLRFAPADAIAAKLDLLRE